MWRDVARLGRQPAGRPGRGQRTGRESDSPKRRGKSAADRERELQDHLRGELSGLDRRLPVPFADRPGRLEDEIVIHTNMQAPVTLGELLGAYYGTCTGQGLRPQEAGSTLEDDLQHTLHGLAAHWQKPFGGLGPRATRQSS